MSQYDWTSVAGHGQRAQNAWPETVVALPVGMVVTCRVIAKMPFGVFVLIDGDDDAVGLMEITTMPRDADLPEVGRTLKAVVADHASHNFQVRLRPVGD
jgi:hypothetical protein